VTFCYADPTGFSGQKAATELVVAGWDCRRLRMPVFRDEGRPRHRMRFAARLLGAWLRALALLGAPGGWLCVNIGQTRFAFVRDALPLLLGASVLGRRRVLVVLHGSLFMRWPPRSWDARVFAFLLRRAGTVVALGATQRSRLLELGVPAAGVAVLVNTCDQPVLAEAEVRAKHDPAAGEGRPLRLLFLSSLIDTKGYPEFLRAARGLGTPGGTRLEVTLCGRLAASEFSDRFPDLAAAERWIEGEIAALGRQPQVVAQWIRGAAGAEKADLFRRADIFVLPTRYPVEAQPLVLLEAMAAGCAIVCSEAGEIPTILDAESAILIGRVSEESVGAALRALALDPGRRQRLAVAANRRYRERYGRERHLDRWEQMLGGRPGPVASP
jgi:glycosyltransferase involved in cell wall biosynthesis